MSLRPEMVCYSSDAFEANDACFCETIVRRRSNIIWLSVHNWGIAEGDVRLSLLRSRLGKCITVIKCRRGRETWVIELVASQLLQMKTDSSHVMSLPARLVQNRSAILDDKLFVLCGYALLNIQILCYLRVWSFNEWIGRRVPFIPS